MNAGKKTERPMENDMEKKGALTAERAHFQAQICAGREIHERTKKGNKDLPDGRKLLPQKPREGRTMRAWSGVSCPTITRPWDLSLSNIAAPNNPIYVKIRTLKITIFGLS